MKDEEILKTIEAFSDYLQVGDIVNYVLRWLGWFLIVGLSLIVDALEGVTDAILGIKGFFNSPEIQNFVDMLYPLFVVLLAISFLYIGYMFIMNKQMNRSQIIINIFVTLSVLCLLSTGMTKVDKFTDDAIAVVKSEQKGSLSDEIIKKNITDIAVLDENKWKKKEDMNPKNHIPEKNIRQIDITEKIDKDFEFAKDKKLSDEGQKILKNKRVMDGMGVASLAELKDGWFDFFPEKYYRWHWNFWNIFFTLLITGATLLLVSIKLARLFYELAFNYLLANILAPADVANGQKLKAVLSNILNIFIATIMIFLSLKLYIMGTAFLHDKLNGVPYLIALAAFSMAVLDGPAVVERLFGIDIGLKSSWGMLAGGLAGGFALGKGIGALANSKPMKSLGNMIGKGAKGAAEGTGVAAAKTASAAAMATGGMAGLISGLKKGNESENKESLQDQMKKADQKKANGNDLANKEKEKGNINKEEDKKNGGTPSIQEDMKKEGNENPGVANGQESGTTSLQDEMKEAGKENGANEGSQTPGTVRQGASEENPTAGGVRQGSSEGSQTPGTVRQGASEGSQTPGTVRQGASEGNPTAGGVRQGSSEGSQTPGTVRQGTSEGSQTPGTVRQGTSEGSQTPGTVRQGASEGSQTPGTVRQGASEGSQIPGTVRQGTSEGNPTAGGVRQGASEGSQTPGTVRQGANEGSPAPMEASRPAPSGGSPAPMETSRPVPSESSPAPVETSRPVPSGSSPAPVETSRPVPSGSSPVPVETSRPVPSGSSPAPVETSRPVPSGSSPAPVETPRSVPSGGSPVSADNVTVTHSSPIIPYESDKEVAASRSQETRTLGQYTTDKVKHTTSSMKQKVKGVQERINNTETVQNTKRFYQMGQNTGKSWRDIVNKNKNNTDKK
ncbi:pLS20_p028 family conjugation system transmembrane protein [Bacillus sp. RC145]|uniref:pLS20_p028 family conjugation system transmembrane protein n=1 Tax=Bacillus sp. RC145 TaxID=3156280 RepID=UPI003850992D